jgi:hypothetical protein
MYTSSKANVPSSKVLTILETTSLFTEFSSFALTDQSVPPLDLVASSSLL